MNVEHPLRESVEKYRGQDPHESGEDHALGATLLDSIGQSGTEGFTSFELPP